MTAVADPTTEREPALTSEPRVRSAIAVLVSRFPRIDETYILREINELERQGQPVLLVPIRRDHGPVIHDEAKPWLDRAIYMPLMSSTIAASNVRRLAREPIRYLGLLGRIVAGTIVRPSTCARSLALFPKGVQLAEMLPRAGVRHVHAHFASHATTLAYVISALSDITYSFTVQGPDVFVHRVMLAEKIRRARFVRTISTFNEAFLRGLYPAVAGNKLHVLHMGVDPNVYERAAREAEHESEALRILSVANLLPNKPFLSLLEAFATLVGAGFKGTLQIVGDGPMRQATEEWIVQHGLEHSVQLTGVLPEHEVARLMGECDLFVLPSSIAPDGQMDGIPMSLVEAMAAGRPVVAAAISGIPELVKHDVTGILVDATLPERLAEAMRRLIDDSALRERLREAARAKVRRDFDVRLTSAAMIELLDRYEQLATTAAARMPKLNWTELKRSAIGIRRVHERRDSLVLEIAVADGIRTREMIIKQHRTRSGESRPPAERARHECAVLETLHERLTAAASGAVSYRVPRLVTCDEGNAALVMTRARGVPLDVLSRQARNRGGAGERLSDPLQRAGGWLRAMQQATRGDADGRHVLTGLLLLALQDIDLAAAADRRIRAKRDLFRDRLRELESRVAARPLPLAGHHGDFWPGNVYISDGAVEVIDFEGYREGLPLEDVAYFLVHLELQFSYPFVRREFSRMRQIFLEAFAPIGGVDEEALQLLTAVKALQILAHGTAAGHGRLRAAWLRRSLREIVIRSLD